LKEIIQSVLENIDGGRLHDVRRKTIPIVNSSLYTFYGDDPLWLGGGLKIMANFSISSFPVGG